MSPAAGFDQCGELVIEAGDVTAEGFNGSRRVSVRASVVIRCACSKKPWARRMSCLLSTARVACRWIPRALRVYEDVVDLAGGGVALIEDGDLTLYGA